MAQKKQKRPLRSANTETTSFRLPIDLIDRVRAEAKAKGVPNTAILAQALREYFAKEDGESSAEA